jgi:DNA (cytosine-5)-methyltransferase 1
VLIVSQGHTGANHQNKIADQRNDELFVAIAEIDRLRPDVFILENVPGMKRDRDEVDELSTTNFALQGIKALRAINYQVRLVQLDSRSFGSPQNRIRLFLICSRKGVLLPTIPKPSHANPVLRKNIFTAGSTRDFFVGEKGEVGSGPLPAVTVRDALSDLPEFEYQFHTPHSQAAQRNRAIKRFDPTQNPCGYRNPEPYRTPPGNDFQTQQRDGARRLQSHYTPHRSDRELQMYVWLTYFQLIGSIFSSDAFVGQTLPSDTPGMSPTSLFLVWS